MTYAEDITRLVHAAAALVAAGPNPAGISDGREQQAALTCRDAVTGVLFTLSRSLLHLRAVDIPADLQLLVASPARALHLALADIRPATDTRLPLSDALSVPGGSLTRSWQHTARAAVALEDHHDALAAGLPPDHEWAVARDLAQSDRRPALPRR